MNQKFTFFSACLFALGVLFCIPTFAQDCEDIVNCGVENGASQPDVAANSTAIDLNGTSAPVTSFSSNSDVFTDFKYVLSSPCTTVGEESTETIVTLSDDGSFDFSGLPAGEYKVTLFAYSQVELDAFAESANPLLSSLFSVEIPCCPVELSEAFDVIGTALGIVPSIEDVEGALCDILPPLGLNLAYGIAQSFTINVGGMVGTNFSTIANAPIQIAQISPVPAINEVQITLAATTFEQATVNVYDIAGQLMTTIPTTISGTNTLNVAISDYAQGVYFVQVVTDSQTVTDKFIKQ